MFVFPEFRPRASITAPVEGYVGRVRILLTDTQKSDPMIPGTLASRKADDFAVGKHWVVLVQIAFCCATPTFDMQASVMRGANNRRSPVDFAMFFILSLS